MDQLQLIFRIIALSSIFSLLIGMTETTTAQIIINEVDADNPGTDRLEFVELYDGGTGNTDLSGLVIVFFNGSDDASYQAFDLDGFSTDANGFFLLGNSAVIPTPSIIFSNNGLQNGADAVALYTGDATDFPNDTPVTTNDLIDAVVYDTNDTDDAGLLPLLHAGQPQVNEGGAGNKDEHSNQRIPNGSGGTRNTNTYSQFPPTPGTPNGGSPDTADVKVFKSAGPDPIVLGDTLTYTICVVNSGPDTARSVTVNDTLPAGVSLLTAFGDQGTCTFGDPVISCDLGDIGENDTVKVSIEVSVEQAGVLTNTACAESETSDPENSNNCDTTLTVVLPADTADVKVFKIAGPDPIVLGDTLTYTICVVNCGPDTARRVTVNDTLPAGVSLLTAFGDQGICSAAGDTVSCDLGDIGENDTVKVSIEVMVEQAGVLTNTACAESETSDPENSNNCDSEATLVVAGQVNVNDKISPMSLLPTFTPGDNIFQFMLNMTNTSSDTIFAPLTVSIDMLMPAPPDVEVDNADNGVRVEGAIYNYSTLLGGDGKWQPGETTGNKLWRFKLSGVFNFTFFANVFGVLPPNGSPVAKSNEGSDNAPFVFVVSAENGTVEISRNPTDVPTTEPLPEEFTLEQNYPNPFNPETVIRYQLPQDSEVKLSIHNLLGQEIRTLVNEKKDAGHYDVIWDGRDSAGQQVASGVYLYRLRTGEFTQVKKLTLLR